MTYQAGDTILYGSQGVFRIAEIAEKDLNGSPVEYYVLKPIFDDRSITFVPVHSEAINAKMRRVLSVEEIYSLVKAMPDEGTIWIENEKMRRDHYGKILAHGDRTELVRLIKTLYLHRQEQRGKGKKLYMTDEKFMKTAERILYEEFAHVLNIKLDQVLPFIMEQVQVEEKPRT
ncbi:MAG: CarD family transcriptional regulator [Clostridiales Family XIII bacterium]|jgi:CarD family transcriptional regulator|nr:CarD family transcriptional regulator [Clostridiales Family XIII bacterium]